MIKGLILLITSLFCALSKSGISNIGYKFVQLTDARPPRKRKCPGRPYKRK